MNKDNKKKLILIFIGVVLVSVILGIIIGSIIGKSSINKENALRSILNDALEINTIIDDDKTMELVSLEGKENIGKVKIWVFSEPIYLGEFTLVNKDNKYYLGGLEGVLKTKDLESGSHRLLVMQDDKAIGYIKIEIDSDKTFKTNRSALVGDENVSGVGAEDIIDENGSLDNKENSSSTEEKKPVEPAKKEETKKEEKKPVSEVKEDAKVETPSIEEPKAEEVKCTPKKFKNKYTYFYEDYNTCVKNGDNLDAWDYFKKNNISAYTYGCEEIKDECGTTYYGVYYGNTNGEKYYY